LSLEFTTDLVGALVENLPGGDGLTLGLARVGDLEEANEEVRDLRGRLRLLAGHALGLPGPYQTESDSRHAEDQGQNHERPGGDSERVPPHELLHPVRSARRARQHRLVSEMPANVGRQLARRVIASGAVLLESLHGDPVEIAVKLACQRRWFRTTVLGRRRRLLAQPGQPHARPRGLLLSDLAPHLIESRPPQLPPVEGLRPDEHLVEHHAEGVDIGPGVDIELGHFRLLGAHVLRRPDELPDRGE